MPGVQQPSSVYTAFISYAREDEGFARHLENAIEAHQSLNATAPLTVFRDRSDFTGAEYNRALQGHLQRSTRLIVVCSPNARRSAYVGDEIRQFVGLHGTQRIYPVLVGGLADNEADELKSFPPALIDALGGIPLAADYRGFDTAPRRFNDPRFESEWFKLLANLQDTTASEIRANDKQLQLRALRATRFRLSGLIVAVVAIAVVMALLWRRAREAEARERLTSEQAQTILSAKDRELERLEAELRSRPTAAAASRPATSSLAQPSRPETTPGATAPPTQPRPGVAPLPGPPPPPYAAPADTASTAPAVPAQARVYFHIRDQSQRDAARQLQDRLQRGGYVVPGIQTIAVGPSTSELRYFRKADEAEAQKIKSALGLPGLVVKLIPGYDNSTDIPPRHYELWLSPGAAASAT
ncbi:MAG TPA: toll/interleukin-1 receptor domain-containing protein [Vicinamibacterales bacterium]|nr:toll/interleukin-1 receptor domain-containing protein [Vicinamibacterales bacterium]